MDTVLYNRIKQLAEQGSTVTAACLKLGISRGECYKAKHKLHFTPEQQAELKRIKVLQNKETGGGRRKGMNLYDLHQANEFFTNPENNGVEFDSEIIEEY